MILVKEKFKKYSYALECQFSVDLRDFCRHLMEKYGYASFGFMQKKWRFSSLEAALELLNRFEGLHASEEVKADLERHGLKKVEETVRNERALKCKNTASAVYFMVPGLKGELRQYQTVGAAFLAARDGNAILADQMGTGKTVQSLAYVLSADKKKTLVVCPASVKSAWESEVKKWTELRPLVIGSKTELSPEEFDGHDVFVINYDQLRKHFKRLMSYRFDHLIMDEFHYIKNNSAQRTKIAMALADNIGSVTLLSGTPVLSRPVELFNALHLMDPNQWNSWVKYTLKYCAGHETRFGYDCRGASNIEDLKKRIAPYFLRRTKDEVLPDLPPKRHISQPVPLDKEHASMYEDAEKTFLQFLDENRGSNSPYISGVKLAHLAEMRQIASMGKLYAATDIINAVIDNGEKILVFSCYNAPLEKLMETYGDRAAMITGKTPEAMRKEAIRLFQNDPSVDVFLGGLRSAGVGITLTAANNVLFIDRDWVPANHQQAEDRVHRLGQEARSVAIYQLYSPDTIDDRMHAIFRSKKRLVDKLVEKGEDTGEVENSSVAGEVLKAYEDKALDK